MHTTTFLSIVNMSMRYFPVSCDAGGGISSHGAAVCATTLHNHQPTNPCSAPLLRVNICLCMGHTLEAYIHTFLGGHRCKETCSQMSKHHRKWCSALLVFAKLLPNNQTHTRALSEKVSMFFYLLPKRMLYRKHMLDSTERCIERVRW